LGATYRQRSGGRIAADGLAQAITDKYGNAEGEVALITSLPGVGSPDQRAKGFGRDREVRG
jgi:ribose transport system substrate-binding protein